MREQTFFLSSAFPSFGYNGTALRPQNVETSVKKNKSCNHHNANDRFGLNSHLLNRCLLILLFCDKPNVYIHPEVVDMAEVLQKWKP